MIALTIPHAAALGFQVGVMMPASRRVAIKPMMNLADEPAAGLASDVLIKQQELMILKAKIAELEALTAAANAPAPQLVPAAVEVPVPQVPEAIVKPAAEAVAAIVQPASEIASAGASGTAAQAALTTTAAVPAAVTEVAAAATTAAAVTSTSFDPTSLLVPVAAGIVLVPAAFLGARAFVEFVDSRYEELSGGEPNDDLSSPYAAPSAAAMPPPSAAAMPPPPAAAAPASGGAGAAVAASGLSAPAIVARGFENLAKDPSGWLSGRPSPLSGTAPDVSDAERAGGAEQVPLAAAAPIARPAPPLTFEAPKPRNFDEPVAFTPSTGNLVANQYQRRRQEEGSLAEGVEQQPVPGRSAPEIVAKGMENLAQDPLGWMEARPSPLNSLAPPQPVAAAARPSPPSPPITRAAMPPPPAAMPPPPAAVPPPPIGPAEYVASPPPLPPPAGASSVGVVVPTGQAPLSRKEKRAAQRQQKKMERKGGGVRQATGASRVPPSTPEELELARQGKWSYGADDGL